MTSLKDEDDTSAARVLDNLNEAADRVVTKTWAHRVKDSVNYGGNQRLTMRC